MKACAECMLCLLNRDIAAVPQEIDAAHKAAYLREVFAMLSQSDPALCTPQLSARIDAVYERHFGARKQKNFAELKRVYNERLLALEPRLQAVIDASDDPLACAIKLARVGNYIDFGGRHEVDDALFDELLASVSTETLDPAEYAHLVDELERAERVVYLADNAGEVVLDKLLLRLLMKRYPNAQFTLLVRGQPTLNDVTAEDARIVGLDAMLPVIGNGSGLPGTVLDELSDEARSLLEAADVLIAKGQGNFETLCGCGYNVYYLLLCKCELFVRRFAVPRLTGLFVNERRLPDFRD